MPKHQPTNSLGIQAPAAKCHCWYLPPRFSRYFHDVSQCAMAISTCTVAPATISLHSFAMLNDAAVSNSTKPHHSQIHEAQQKPIPNGSGTLISNGSIWCFLHLLPCIFHAFVGWLAFSKWIWHLAIALQNADALTKQVIFANHRCFFFTAKAT